MFSRLCLSRRRELRRRVCPTFDDQHRSTDTFCAINGKEKKKKKQKSFGRLWRRRKAKTLFGLFGGFHIEQASTTSRTLFDLIERDTEILLPELNISIIRGFKIFSM
jgi:hypothetical protein